MTQNYEEISAEKLTPKKDIVFKKLFGQKGSEDALASFLECILDTKISSLEFNQNTELLGKFDDSKDSRIDVCAQLRRWHIGRLRDTKITIRF